MATRFLSSIYAASSALQPARFPPDEYLIIVAYEEKSAAIRSDQGAELRSFPTALVPSAEHEAQITSGVISVDTTPIHLLNPQVLVDIDVSGAVVSTGDDA